MSSQSSPDSRQSGTADPATLPGIEEATAEKESFDSAWNVIVHNDPVNLMNYVVMIFQRVFGFSKEKAQHHMLEVHFLGKSVVWSGMREKGEFYVQQLHSHLLLATLERTD
jgi:ATP-dependent Clp protease adaptor protein ClpS